MSREQDVWAVIYRNRLAVFDGRAPIYWRRGDALKANVKHLGGRGFIAKITLPMGDIAFDAREADEKRKAAAKQKGKAA